MQITENEASEEFIRDRESGTVRFSLQKTKIFSKQTLLLQTYNNPKKYYRHSLYRPKSKANHRIKNVMKKWIKINNIRMKLGERKRLAGHPTLKQTPSPVL